MKTIRIVLVAMLFAVTQLRAQLVTNGATDILSNVTNCITGDVP